MADKQFGERLKKIAKEKNLSIKAIAEEAQISPNTLYSSIKRGSRISADALCKVTQILGAEPIELMPTYMQPKAPIVAEIYQINFQELTVIQLKTLIDNATNELLRRIGD
jgi:transcriptional regulator with XRE-family HTH domain